jgi:hypothetical protein
MWKREPSLLQQLSQHFGGPLVSLPVLQRNFEVYERPNVHLAIEQLARESAPGFRLIGIVSGEDYTEINLAKLTHPDTADRFREGPVQYADQAIDLDASLACVQCGLYTLHFGEEPVVILLTTPIYSHRGGLIVQVMAKTREVAEQVMRRITREVQAGKVYRGKILSLSSDCNGSLNVLFHALPKIDRDSIILPEAILARIERHSLGYAKHRERLQAAARHLKRGILLHGPPGTGKTLSAMFIAGQMPGRTTIMVTGRGAGMIELASKLARMLQPATVILEDVDLIGTERAHQEVGANALLFELLNEMDGLAEDADVLFLLTTNRPDHLEPALASRPGRIDQAIEVPLPDADCRARLFDLYRRGLACEVDDWQPWIARTAGVSAAFIRELLRKAALISADDSDGPLLVRPAHLDAALGELVIAGGRLTQTLLGGRVVGEEG